jgi:hypothetical protein
VQCKWEQAVAAAEAVCSAETAAVKAVEAKKRVDGEVTLAVMIRAAARRAKAVRVEAKKRVHWKVS